MTYLSIDYGEQYIGLAVAAGPLAEPLLTVKKDQALAVISQLIDQHAVGTLIIGLSEGQMANKTRAFANELEATFNLPIIFQDETLTSQETRLKAAQMGMKKTKREGKIDHLVATAILQDYLDSHS